ncbi:MAG: amidase family protein [Pseudomonadota bacterium]
MTDLCYLSATEALAMFRSKALSPVELLEAQIVQSESWEPRLNAFSHRFFDQALEQARESEVRWANGNPCGPLDGIPVAMKDEIDVAGQPNTEGSLIYKDRIADKDAVLAARLRAAGAIFHARTTCPEFCSLWNTTSRLFGVTNNPFNLEVTPGGSSGGSGAALAAGMTTLATGSDIGGSIRFPASMCGLVGFKPPYGRVPETYVPFNMETYCANGPMARTVADTALMQNVISGAHPEDAASQLPTIELPMAYADDLQGLRVAFSMNMGYLDVEDDVVSTVREALARLESLGATITEVDPGFPDGISRAYYGHMDPLFFAAVAEKMETARDQMCDYNIAMAKVATRRLDDKGAYYAAASLEAEMYARFGRLMQNFDVFVCPTVMTNRLPAGFNPVRDKYLVGGKVQKYDLDISTCHIFNMMGRCPALSVPAGIGDNGVPTGLHIASTAYDDERVFRVAGTLETTCKIEYPALPA